MSIVEDAWRTYFADALARIDVDLEPGLSEEELSRLERVVGGPVPRQLRILLEVALPLGAAWYDWRQDPAGEFARWHTWVVTGMLFDVEHNGFWHPNWPPRPVEPTERAEVVRAALRHVPTLLPIRGHRAIATDDPEGSSPIFSVWQTDVIGYGADVADWLHREFAIAKPDWSAVQPRRVPFWSGLTGARPPR